MTEELKKCLTLIFRCKGTDSLSTPDFVYAASMNLHWFPPKDAQKLLEIALSEKLLKISEGKVSPTFQLLEENMELDYRPSSDLLKSHTVLEKKDLFSEITEKIITEAKLSKKEAVARINKMRERMGVDTEVAALLVARSFGIDIDEEISTATRQMLSD